jgi:hypothetical protein
MGSFYQKGPAADARSTLTPRPDASLRSRAPISLLVRLREERR